MTLTMYLVAFTEKLGFKAKPCDDEAERQRRRQSGIFRNGVVSTSRGEE